MSVSVRTGPVTATQRAYDVPKEKWSLLLQRRKYFLQVNIPHDCRLLFDFIEDARECRMWESVEMADQNHVYRSFADLDDLVRNGLGIDPQIAEWAIAGIKKLRPEDAEKAISLAKAVYSGARELAADRRAAIARLIGQNPPPTHQQIADAVGLSRSRTTEIVGEMSATTAPKLLNHGGKREGQGAYKQVEGKGSNKADYILARLRRDGRDDLAEQVGDGKISARKAGMMAGFVKPQSALTILKREWRRASSDERQAFLAWVDAPRP